LLVDYSQKMADARKSERKKKSGFISAMGNFSIQYNLSSISAALPIMTDTLFTEPDWATYVLKGLVFAGSVFGMCVMGYLGDLIGRRKAMLTTLFFTVIGSLGCALFPWGYDDNVIFAVMSACRFILGVGVGGIYPLSAATASEGSSADATHAEVAKDVGWAFFWQTPGAMAPYAVALALLQLGNSTVATEVTFRVLMGIGALPAAIVFFSALGYSDSEEFKSGRVRSPLRDALEHRQYWRTLAGTAGTWFLYDIAYYGTNIFTPEIIENIFGKENNTEMCWHSLVAQAIGIPGCIAAILALKPKGGYWLMYWGFLLNALLFGMFAMVYNIDRSGSTGLKFTLYCLLTFALNFGPNVATYVLPAVSFPVQVRTIFHGLSAAGAKLGAVTGSYIFQPVSDGWGIAGVMWMQFALSILGAIVTVFFIQKDRPAKDAPLADQFERSPLLSSSRSLVSGNDRPINF
jgi:PHS family inorganic phosphate transporter-like MFS transporter